MIAYVRNPKAQKASPLNASTRLTDNFQISHIFSLLQEAAGEIMRIYRQDDYTSDMKSDNSPVTEADLASNRIISEGLGQLFPDIPVLSEESVHEPYETRRHHPRLWLLDPLDGTKEFIRKTDEFSINLALIEDGQPVMGFIALPVTGEIYFAARAQGAWEIRENERVPLSAATFSLSDTGLNVVASRSHIDDLTRTFINRLHQPSIVSLGSALKFISIANGKAHYYPRMVQIMEWDTAAGQILIEEAGGSMVDAQTGQPLRYNKPSLKNPFFIASGRQN